MIWTIKESLSKVLKCGLMTPLHVLEIAEIDCKRPIRVSTFKNFAQYKVLSVVMGDVALSICLPKRTELDLGALLELDQGLA